MTLDLLVRPMTADEVPMVLSNWKRELGEYRHIYRWSSGLKPDDFWSLLNFVIDRLTLPSCVVFMGCHPSEPKVPINWVAIRKRPGLSNYDVVYQYVRLGPREDPELAQSLYDSLIEKLCATHTLEKKKRPFNPFNELRRELL